MGERFGHPIKGLNRSCPRASIVYVHTANNPHQFTFFGHVMRKGKLKNVLSTGSLENKRVGEGGQGKTRESMLSSLTSLNGGTSVSSIIGCTRDRKKPADKHGNHRHVAWTMQRIICFDE